MSDNEFNIMFSVAHIHVCVLVSLVESLAIAKAMQYTQF